MPIVTFQGYIWPRDLKITIDGTTMPMKWSEPDIDGGYTAELTVFVKDGSVAARCDIDNFTEATLHFLNLRAFINTRAIVDACSVGSGLGMILIWDTAVLPNGTVVPIRASNPELKGLLGPISESELVSMAITETALFDVLNDLATTLQNDLKTSVNCGRVVEALCHLILPNASKNSQWRALRSALNVSQEYLTLITSESIGPRHGQVLPIRPATLSEIQVRAWTIFRRFLEFRRCGNVALTDPPFPLL
jgi:hypothetical protein